MVHLLRYFEPNVLIMELGVPLLSMADKLSTATNSVRVIAEAAAKALHSLHSMVWFEISETVPLISGCLIRMCV